MANPTPQEVREAAQKVIAQHISERPGICAQPHGGDFRATWPCGELIQAQNALAMADEVDRQKDRVQGYYNEAATAYEKLQVVEAERKAMAEAVENLWARLNVADPTGDFGGKDVTLAPAPSAPTREEHENSPGFVAKVWRCRLCGYGVLAEDLERCKTHGRHTDALGRDNQPNAGVAYCMNCLDETLLPIAPRDGKEE